jgi:hypothetical protein
VPLSQNLEAFQKASAGIGKRIGRFLRRKMAGAKVCDGAAATTLIESDVLTAKPINQMLPSA